MSRKLQRLDLVGPAGRLEALLTAPAGSPRAAALVCHPHPQHGGSMHTRAVHHTALALVETGLCALRFNFRGVGRSEGSFGGGAGEREDARAMLRWLAQSAPGLPLVLAGFSFGAAIALGLAPELAAAAERVAALVGVGPALVLDDFGFLAATRQPVLLVAGDRDPYSPRAALQGLQARLGSRLEVVLLLGAGHLLVERLPELRAAVRAFVARVLQPDSP